MLPERIELLYNRLFFEHPLRQMVTLDKNRIDALSKLAQIEVSEEECADYIKDCSTILAFVNQIQSVNTEDIAPLSHALDAVQRLRLDEVTETNQRDALEQLSEHIESHLYAVPKVIE